MPRAYFDDEGPTEHDTHLLDDGPENANDTVPCPRCRREILAFADRCHWCGEYFGREAWLVQPSAKRSIWIIAAVLAVAAMLWLVLG